MDGWVGGVDRGLVGWPWRRQGFGERGYSVWEWIG